VSCSHTNISSLIELSTEQFLKKMAGKADIEDALKRLDKLTNDEARMATAQVLKATRTVDDRVRGVDDRVATEMAGVNDRVAGVDEKVEAVYDNVDQMKRGLSPNVIHLPPESHMSL
jgi:hypothetical protein